MSFVVHQADHIISEKHDGATTAENLAFACSLCNKYKGSDIATLDQQTGEITALFNPRSDNWNEHFQLDGNGALLSSTAIGRGTTRLLRLNQAKRMEERRLLVVAGLIPSICLLLRDNKE